MINWEEQWALHARHYREGRVQLDLKDYGATVSAVLTMRPGPGFGDLSHPTTRLVLEMLCEQGCADEDVLDIGCGSGILSLAATALGAKTVVGIDIEDDAITHSQANATLNGFDNKIRFLTTEQYRQQLHKKLLPQPSLVLMNMICSEQNVAWNSLPELHNTPLTLITSGILASEKQAYIDNHPNFSFTDTRESNGWVALRGQ